MVCFCTVCMTMSKGIVALFSASSRPVAPFVHLETGATFSMPYVTTAPSVNSSTLGHDHGQPLATGGDHPADGSVGSPPQVVPEPGKGHLSLHIRPLIHRAMLAVIRRHRWTVVYYLYDSVHGQCTIIMYSDI